MDYIPLLIKQAFLHVGFTPLTFDEVADWLAQFDIGQLAELKGIAAGITNTNYFVYTTQNKFVLTILRKNTLVELPYFVDLMVHLAANGVLCPTPVLAKNGVALHLLHGKPAMMVSCLQGADIAIPSLNQVEQVATSLAKMHVAGLQFKQKSHNQRDATWRAATAQKVLPKLSAQDQTLLQTELDFQHNLAVEQLPHGVVHGDLFRDNVLFDGEQLGGFIDFYYACEDILAYDVAIAVNEWCLHHNGADLGTFDADKIQAFLAAYQTVRPFEATEKTLWPAMLRRAALRFWLSRLDDFYFPATGELTHTKDPNHFKSILQQHLVSFLTMAILESQPKTSVGWVKECFALFQQSPRRWLMLALVYVLFFMMIPSTPGMQFFAVITILCWPLFMAAAALLYQAQDTKKPLLISQLFSRLQPKLQPLLWLGLGCLVYVILVSWVLEGDAQVLQTATQAQPKMTEAQAIQAVKNMLPLVFKVGVFLIPLMMATWFSPMLIVQNHYSVLKSVKSSIAGSLQFFVALIGTWLLLIVGIVLAILGVSILLGLVGSLVPTVAKLLTPMLVFGVLLTATALMFAFQYISYRDVFRAAPTD